MAETISPGKLSEMSVMVAQPGLERAQWVRGQIRGQTIEPAIPGQVYPAVPGIVFQSEEPPHASLELTPRALPWGGRATILREETDRLLIPPEGRSEIASAHNLLYSDNDFGNLGEPNQISLGDPQTVEIRWLGDANRGFIGGVMGQRERGELAYEDLIALTDNSSIVATSRVIPTRLVDYHGEDKGDINLMFGTSVTDGINGYVGGNAFLAMQQPGKDPDISWAGRFTLSSTVFPKKNVQALRNFAEFMAFIKDLTPEMTSKMRLNVEYMGTHYFMRSLGHHISEAEKYPFVGDYFSTINPNVTHYPRELAAFPQNLSIEAVEEQKQRLTSILVTRKAISGSGAASVII